MRHHYLYRFVENVQVDARIVGKTNEISKDGQEEIVLPSGAPVGVAAGSADAPRFSLLLDAASPLVPREFGLA
jgi:hypothetical protein